MSVIQSCFDVLTDGSGCCGCSHLLSLLSLLSSLLSPLLDPLRCSKEKGSLSLRPMGRVGWSAMTLGPPCVILRDTRGRERRSMRCFSSPLLLFFRPLSPSLVLPPTHRTSPAAACKSAARRTESDHPTTLLCQAPSSKRRAPLHSNRSLSLLACFLRSSAVCPALMVGEASVLIALFATLHRRA